MRWKQRDYSTLDSFSQPQFSPSPPIKTVGLALCLLRPDVVGPAAIYAGYSICTGISEAVHELYMQVRTGT